MKPIFSCLAMTVFVVGCDPRYGTLPPVGSPDRFPSNNSSSSPFNDKNYADPNPHSYSGDAQRSAFIQHQKDQQGASHSFASPVADLSGMHCKTISTTAGSPNNTVTTSHTSCHN
jgi:hypothetical protein